LSSVSRIVKGWLKANKIEGHGSLLSLSKTWALHAENTAAPVSRNKGSRVPDYLRPVRVPTRQEVVYKKLENAILSGHIRPGERIITEEVAQRLGVSKIPVREALRGLEAGGLISTKPNCGSTVTELSKENLEEILEIRINLECIAARKARSFLSQRWSEPTSLVHSAKVATDGLKRHLNPAFDHFSCTLNSIHL